MMEGLAAPSALAPRGPARLPFVLVGMLGPIALVMMAIWFGGQVRQTDLMRAMNRASYERRIAAAELLNHLADAETMQRGFVVTGNPQFLESYDSSRAVLVSELSQLGQLYQGLPDQVARIAQLRQLIEDDLGEMAAGIRRRQQGRTALPEPDAVATDIGLKQRIRATIGALMRTEEGALGLRVAYVRQHNVVAQRFMWTLVVLTGAILLLGLWTLWRSRIQHYRMEFRVHMAAARLRAIFASTTDAIMILSPQGVIEAVNAATTRMLGYAPSELIDRDASALLDVADGDGSFHRRIGLVDGRLVHPSWLDRSVRHRDGHAVPVDIALGLMPQPGELYIVAALRDISERKAVERLKDEFVATVSHELRTPLTSVVGSLGLLRAGSVGTLPDAARRLVEIAENNSRRLIRLINDILDIEKIGSGRMRFESEPFDLVDMAERAIDGSRGLAEAQRVELELSTDARPIIVRGDEERLVQVITNLLSNAIRFSPDQGCVKVLISRGAREVLVAVEDQGPGIPPEFQGRIFERFAQAWSGVRRAGTGTGTGLGLAISREIVAAHEGRIWFDRMEGHGARLTFSLPLPERAAQRADVRHARLLVCEAQVDVANRLRCVLEREGYAVDCVATARQAEEGAQSGRYDALLIDPALPDAHGLEVVRTLRRKARTLPIIVLSPHGGADGEELETPAIDLVDWIDKPVDQTRLNSAIRRAIEHSVPGRPTILHIDDDVDMLEVTSTALADQGRILRATSIADAREMLVEHRPDIVILDLNLPDGNGLDLISELQMADGAAIPTIIYAAEDVTPEVRRQVDAALVKSRRSLPSLARTIRRILASASAALETS
jgi:PAS domain S-box-containing protein